MHGQSTSLTPKYLPLSSQSLPYAERAELFPADKQEEGNFRSINIQMCCGVNFIWADVNVAEMTSYEKNNMVTEQKMVSCPIISKTRKLFNKKRERIFPIN